MITVINSVISRYFRSSPMINLGRWGVECENGKRILAHRANVDHCGPCGFDEYKNVEKRYQEIDNNIKFYKERASKKLENI